MSMSLEEWVTKSMNGFTEAELEVAFDCVKDMTNWKLPIDVKVNASVKLVTREQIATAITFYTGSVAEFTDLPDGGYRVQATGYYAEIGA